MTKQWCWKTVPSKEGPHKDATNFRNMHFSLKKAYVLYTSFVGGSGRVLVSIVASFSSLEENVKKGKKKKVSLPSSSHLPEIFSVTSDCLSTHSNRIILKYLKCFIVIHWIIENSITTQILSKLNSECCLEYFCPFEVPDCQHNGSQWEFIAITVSFKLQLKIWKPYNEVIFQA